MAARFNLLLPDLSGHGDSDHTSTYSGDAWASELALIIEREQAEPITVVGHSMGGRVCVYLASEFPDLVQQLILVDCPLQAPKPEGSVPRGRARRPAKVYPTLAETIAQFRLRPAETTADDRLLRAVARMSAVHSDAGWTWKFDPEASQRFTDAELQSELMKVRCPVSLVLGENSSVVEPDTPDYVSSVLGYHVPRVVVPGGFHHVPLNAPVACRVAIERMME
jgi:pimeloyl-ACP methyl ester carboxylesterase